MLSWVAPCGFTTPLSCELRRLGFSLPLHCSALFNHGQVTPFIVYIAAFGRFMRRSRIPKHSHRHIYSRCEVRSCGAGMHRSAAEGRFGEAEPAGRSSVCARALTLGVSSCQEKNVHFTFKNASHPLFIGVRCTLTVRKWVNSDQQGSRYRSAEFHLLRAHHSRLAE
jgi:hypothetical protein